MSLDMLRDLELAGVKWEINEIPAALMADVAAATVHDGGAQKNIAQTHCVPPSAVSRTRASVVPPVAPVRPISVETARAMAARPGDMRALCRMIGEFNHPLRACATNVVLPHIADVQDSMVIITDIPGTEDDATGRILSGGAGELMDKMLSAIGLTRDVVSIVPMLFWRTPGGRTPTAEELDLSRPFVDRAIELLRPRVILTLGTLAAQEIANVALGRGHGQITRLPSGADCMPIYHPNYLLLKPAAKRDVWAALQVVQNLLKSAQL